MSRRPRSGAAATPPTRFPGLMEREPLRLGSTWLLVLGCVAGGSASIAAALTAATALDPVDVTVAVLAFETGPVGALLDCLAATSLEFPGGNTARRHWVERLAVAALFALVFPVAWVTVISYLREARWDHGRSVLTVDRQRPGEDRRWNDRA